MDSLALTGSMSMSLSPINFSKYVHECNEELAERSRDMRSKHFVQISQSITVDEDGFPSVSGISNSTDAEVHPLYDFQMNVVLPNFLRTLVWNMHKNSELCNFFFGSILSSQCCSSSCDLARVNYSDEKFEDVFNAQFGAVLLRGPVGDENTFGIENAVVCDTWHLLGGLETKETAWFEPCKVVFSQSVSGLRLEVIVTREIERIQLGLPEETVYRRTDESSGRAANEWLWAKRMAMCCALTMHQFQYHLVYDHLATESFVALAYRFLHKEHYVFRTLAPVCGDVGFVNRSWGLKVILGDSDNAQRFGPDSSRNGPCAAFPLTPQGAVNAIKRAKQMLHSSNYFWFAEGGYMKGGSGVKDSTSFPFRDDAMEVWNSTLELTTAIVQHHWQSQDKDLAEWWDAIFWGPFESQQKPLTIKNVSNVLATILFVATHRHDYAHSEYLFENNKLLVAILLQGDMQKPSSYLPPPLLHDKAITQYLGLQGGNTENPLDCYVNAFPEIPEVKRYGRSVQRIISRSQYLKRVGVMSH